MNTTSLFVELIVIGAGVGIWLILLLVAVFDFGWLTFSYPELLGSAIPALAVIYVFGIIWDRLADRLFELLWADPLRQSHFKKLENYYEARRIILTRSAALSELLEYGRSRLRICRGWTLNALMIGISLNILAWSRLAGSAEVWWLSLAGSTACLALAAGSWYAWWSLSKAEYRKIKEQSAYLKKDNEDHVTEGSM